MPHIANSNFAHWTKGTKFGMYNQYLETADKWMIKTMDLKPFNAIVSKHTQGMRIEAYMPDISYIYVRQLIPDVTRFQGKSGKLIIDITRDSWQRVKYDVYIRCRMTSDNTKWRPLVIDTLEKELAEGRQVIIVPFTVPELSSEDIANLGTGNALTTAFRIIGGFDHLTRNTDCILHSISMEIDDTVLGDGPTENNCDSFIRDLKKVLKEHNI